MRTVCYQPGELLRWLHRRRGQVVHLPAVPQPVTYLFGQEANAFVFAHDHLFRWREAFQGLIPVDGETALIVSDGPDHTRRRSLVRPTLHRRQVQGYVQLMAQAADELLDPLTSGEVFDAYALFRTAIRRSTLRALFGPRIAGREEEIADLLQPLFDLTDHVQTIGIHERLTTPLWRRAMRARAQLDELIYPEIAHARAAPPDEPGSPVLTMLVGAGDRQDPGLSETEVRDQVVSLIAAGYETTSAAMAWTLYALASRPGMMARARVQLRSVCGEQPPAAADLPELTLLRAIVTESLRLYPPAVVSARSVATDFTLGGRTVRAGTLALISPYVTHRDPQVYPDPLRFRPERWLDGARAAPPAYVPFGGGAHRCIGSTMATTELTVMLARLLARGAYRVTDQRVRAKGLAAMRPAHGLHLRFD